jgi:hypothetical protein
MTIMKTDILMTIREMIMKDIHDMNERSPFNGDKFRWGRLDLNGVNVKDIIFESLSDQDLFEIYKRIIRTFVKQM